MNHFAVRQILTQCCKSTLRQFKKSGWHFEPIHLLLLPSIMIIKGKKMLKTKTPMKKGERKAVTGKLLEG